MALTNRGVESCIATLKAFSPDYHLTLIQLEPLSLISYARLRFYS